MEIRKHLPPDALCGEDAADMEEINKLAKRTLAPDEVYTFSVRLCDNEVDRDGERFAEETLRQLGTLFLGKSGIFDHAWSAKEQTARIYRTELCYEPGVLTAAEDRYCYLKGKAYMLRTEKNRDLIEEIEAGIKKEVSVGCSVREAVCSICGARGGACEHVRGKVYDGKLCYTELRGAEDAYEWSFVAVPAQRGAGVMKRFGGAAACGLKEFLTRMGSEKQLEEYSRLENEAAMGRSYMKGLRREVARLACVAEQDLDGAVCASIVEKLTERELLELQRVYQKRADRLLLPEMQLKFESAAADAPDGSAFLI